MPTLRLPSKAVRGWASKVAPILGIKKGGGPSEGFPKSPTSSQNAILHRKSFVLEHSGSKHLEDIYDISPGKELGVGGFGTVRRASLKGAESVARAVKTVKKCDLKAEELAWREVAILRHLDHPCICRLLETFEDKRHIYLVLELIDGRELFDEIAEQRSLDERWAAGIMQQVFGALQYCHERKVIHRDLKPENIMVRHSSEERRGAVGSIGKRVPQVVLIDFGMALMHDGISATGAGGSSIMGTKDYLAPEAMRGHCTPASDVWSAGMVLHALLVGCLPTLRDEPMMVGAWENVSPAARDLVQGLLVVDASRRMTAAQAAGHLWATGDAAISLTPKHVNNMMKNFMSFHSSVKLRRAALTALAMQLTNQQMADHREQFIAIDSDGNGRISKQELIDSISANSPLSLQDIGSWAESVFDSVDTDGSEDIDYTEWLATAVHESTCRSEQTMRAAFRVFDVDGDGRIDEGEFARVLKQTPQEIASLLPQFDANGDGMIDFEEFKNLLCLGVADAAGQPLSLSRGGSGLSGLSNISGTSGGYRSRAGVQLPRHTPASSAASSLPHVQHPIRSSSIRLNIHTDPLPTFGCGDGSPTMTFSV